jgi:hypothetical protein
MQNPDSYNDMKQKGDYWWAQQEILEVMCELTCNVWLVTGHLSRTFLVFPLDSWLIISLPHNFKKRKIPSCGIQLGISGIPQDRPFGVNCCNIYRITDLLGSHHPVRRHMIIKYWFLTLQDSRMSLQLSMHSCNQPLNLKGIHSCSRDRRRIKMLLSWTHG